MTAHDSATDLLRFTARRLADDIRTEIDRAGTDTDWLNEIEAAARDCDRYLQDARVYARAALREATP